MKTLGVLILLLTSLWPFAVLAVILHLANYGVYP